MISPAPFPSNESHSVVDQLVTGMVPDGVLRTDVNGLFTPEFLNSDGVHSPGDLTWNVYLANWVDRAWKTPHRTPESAARLSSKLVEETTECAEAYGNFMTQRDDKSRQHFLEEAGDVIWAVYANASNAHVDITANLEFIDQVKPILAAPKKQLNDDHASPDKMPRYDNLSTLWEEGWRLNPEALLPMYNVFAPQDIHAIPEDASARLTANAKTLAEAIRYIWDPAKLPQSHDRMVRFGAAYLTTLMADTLLELGSMVRDADSDLTEVLTTLVPKLENRVAANAVDKTDTGRVAVHASLTE